MTTEQMRSSLLATALAVLASAGAAWAQEGAGAASQQAAGDDPRIQNLRQLTFGGENAEAYFSRRRQAADLPGDAARRSACDQKYTMNLDGSDLRRVSTGKGRTTCGYFFPTATGSSTARRTTSPTTCPPPPDRSRGYVWGLYPTTTSTSRTPTGRNCASLTEHARLRRRGDDLARRAQDRLHLDCATATSTSTRWTPTAANVRRLTNEPGYDGGAFFSPDGTKIVYRAQPPRRTPRSSPTTARCSRDG